MAHNDYKQILAETTGNTCGLALVFSAAITTSVASLTLTSLSAVAIIAKSKYQENNAESKSDIYQDTKDSALYLTNAGYRVFNTASPLLFSAGYFVGKNCINGTSCILNTVYNNTVNTVVCPNELEVSFEENDEDGWTVVNTNKLKS